MWFTITRAKAIISDQPWLSEAWTTRTTIAFNRGIPGCTRISRDAGTPWIFGTPEAASSQWIVSDTGYTKCTSMAFDSILPQYSAETTTVSTRRRTFSSCCGRIQAWRESNSSQSPGISGPGAIRLAASHRGGVNGTTSTGMRYVTSGGAIPEG